MSRDPYSLLAWIFPSAAREVSSSNRPKLCGKARARGVTRSRRGWGACVCGRGVLAWLWKWTFVRYVELQLHRKAPEMLPLFPIPVSPSTCCEWRGVSGEPTCAQTNPADDLSSQTEGPACQREPNPQSKHKQWLIHIQFKWPLCYCLILQREFKCCSHTALNSRGIKQPNQLEGCSYLLLLLTFFSLSLPAQPKNKRCWSTLYGVGVVTGL